MDYAPKNLSFSPQALYSTDEIGIGQVNRDLNWDGEWKTRNMGLCAKTNHCSMAK